MSTPITQLPIPPSVASLSPSTPSHFPAVNPRRPSISSLADSPHLSHLSPNTSPSSVKSFDSSNSRLSKSDNDSLPLSIDSMIESVDLLKESTLKLELTRHGIPIPASLSEKRKKLKKAVRDRHRKFICESLSMTQPEPESVTNAISTMEQSIIDLQAEIKAHHTTLDELILCSDKKQTKSPPTELPKELTVLSTRIEKMEELLGKYKENQEDVSNTVNECKKVIDKVKSQSAESCTRLRSMQNNTHDVSGSVNNSNSRQSRPTRSQPLEMNDRIRQKPPDRRHQKTRNVLLIHDSQLNNLDPNKFSSGFSVQKFKGGSYKEFLNKHTRTVISKPQIDCYVLELGVNDYRYDLSQANLKKAIEDAKNSIEKLLQCSGAKIVVSLPTPTPGPYEDHTSEFNKALTDFITLKRGLSDYYRRLYTVNNFSNFATAIEASTQSDSKPNPLIDHDNLHVSDYGLRKLCLNIKLGIYRAFGMKAPRKQTPTQ